MNPSAIFIHRPVMTTLVMTSLIIFGVLGLLNMPVSDLPNVDFPTIQVSASLPGASPETVASSVATPLEKQFSTIAGIDSMSSVSSLGSTQITLQFTLDRSIDAAAQDVQAAIGKANRLLPADMPSPPSYQKVNPADTPIFFMGLTSSSLPLPVVNEYAETLIAQRLSTIDGVAQVQIQGPQKYAVRITLDPNRLFSYGIGLEEVARAINSANPNLATGTLFSPAGTYTIKVDGQIMRADRYRNIIIAYRNGSPVRLSDVGRADDSVEDTRTAAWLDGTRGIMMSIQRQPGSNTVKVVDHIREALPALQAQLPADVKLLVVYDRSQTIRGSIEDVEFTLILSVFLVVGVIFVFLRNVSATLIPGLALPLSIMGTFALMQILGLGINNLSLMSLTLSVGFVVDDAIVMLENIVRRMEHGEDPHAASIRGSEEIGFTILSMTLSLAAVFLPILFMGGIVGRLMHEFAVVISIAILISGFVSISLTPMLCSRFLRPHGAVRHNFLYRATEAIFLGVLAAYRVTLGWTMRLRFLVLLGSFALLYGTFHAFVALPKGFIPDEDIGSIFGSTEAVQGTPFDALVEKQGRVAAIIMKHPAVEHLISSVGGGGGGGGTNTGRVFIRLKPREGRKPAADVIEDLRRQLGGLPGIKVFLQIPPAIRIGGRMSKSQYQVTLTGPDSKQLIASAQALQGRMESLPGLVDVSSDLEIRNPEVRVAVDREKASARGLSLEDIERTMSNAFSERQISTIFSPSNQFKVIMTVDPAYQRGPETLRDLYMRSQNGALVPLETVATVERGVGPTSVSHAGQLTAVTLSFNLKPGTALGTAITAVQKAASEVLPATVSLNLAGTAQVFQNSMQGLLLLVLMSIVVIYMILGILYESFIHPITILSGLPSAALGALLTLQWFKLDLNLYGFVGVIMLVGIVKKNAIMMIDFALAAQRSDGRDPERAIVEGCLIRFRPIMMTTAAAIMGTLPIAMGLGAGAESRRPLGLAVVGGLCLSQLLTLYITPVYFVYFEKLMRGVDWLRVKLFGRRDPPGDAAVATPRGSGPGAGNDEVPEM